MLCSGRVAEPVSVNVWELYTCLPKAPNYPPLDFHTFSPFMWSHSFLGGPLMIARAIFAGVSEIGSGMVFLTGRPRGEDYLSSSLIVSIPPLSALR